MSDAVVYEQLDQEAQPSASALAGDPTGGGGVPFEAGSENGADLRRLSDVLMELSVEIGRTRMTVGEMLQLRAGSIVTLERLAGEPVDLLVNGTPIARGEVVIVDEQFGLRVNEIVEGDPTAADIEERGNGEEGTDQPGGRYPAPPRAGEGAGGDPVSTGPTAQG